MISLSIKTEKIEQQHLIKGKNGKIISVILYENKNGKGQYGDDGYAVQGVTKEARAAGVRRQIIGNWRHIEFKSDAPKAQAKPQAEDADSDTPF